jgi:hypothetical protein
MLKKLSIVLSLAAVLGLGVVFATPDAAVAQQHQHKNKNVVHKNVVHKNVVHNKFVVGKKYNGHVWYGKSRHRWHGRWYDYGVGPCWINVDGLWFWNVAACG